MTKTTFTSESVCAGHPDKICDQISDAILDAVLVQDPQGRTAIECLAGNNRLIIAGEIGAKAKVDFKKIAREQITRLGYTDPKFNFSDQSPIEDYVHEQSPEIAVGVKKKGAGDQGMMFGFACRETPQLMPLPIMIAHALVKRIDQVREEKILPYLRPDGKSQVTVEYQDSKPIAVKQVVIAVPHKESVDLKQVRLDIFKKVVKPILENFGFKISIKDLIVNGTGVWHNGGPASDCGLTGRKIIVDSYGGYARVGGGCFSGKEPSKVDRGGAYAARFLAKNIVANKLADKCEVRLAYFIGARKPTMQDIETFGTAKKSSKLIKDFMDKILDTSVEGILQGLDLRRPIYLPTASYGHFGREEFPWEKVV
ncbi:methionine adenosyltransferase [Candidatus Daviesbacteria bacterium RIFCSPLOWO2_01_FULL_38_10]|uniref:Methionine adenosyltransferase n=1 Tax=Candidatus Daviesbacteria bacterium GW2011_GWF2_38_6 TaxID=1618432 RepID=A0A0G0KSA6_9BACT|nr:MAG: S-adenosylmethionine synthase [Candidatus Daviesbacteria bacterium GW2011_GWA2_38_17]KKQ78420.1 MAG: S-adenosylmethionine synthase [Candidatus Daviesbacteria bacterium GW2011_GWF2_38_6]OGE27182.1 MAG: methionine adenosyltransferase [Candidatus Daviesbacteria bacterium RIFCSPHIGHO2_02_FULL_39_41]OGE40207.1 MAG: methionine adenosyltransferase [Candidatus Daviesbacteria bacterium RIFCSPLOWO2_01_FULL_38_10]OGE45235.1 MAG: methionine adenosyltransferase [Candidatus Daviesbacteria bacterium R